MIYDTVEILKTDHLPNLSYPTTVTLIYLSVVFEDKQPVESAYDSYRLSDLVPGQPLRRTILTSNDFRIALNIRPTIVKSSQG